jgi:hypothetical protein
LAVFAAVGLLHPASECEASIVGIDARSSGEDSTISSSPSFSSFRSTIESLGHTLIPLSTFDSADLAGLDALILRQNASFVVNPHLSDSEMQSIVSFTRSGGGLLAIAEAGNFTNGTVNEWNTLVEPFGIRFSTDLNVGGDGLSIQGFADHPVTRGVMSVTLDFYRPLDLVGSPAVDLTLVDGVADFLAVVDGTAGAGNLAFIGDTSLWADPGDDSGIQVADNHQLLRNLIQFVVVPEPHTAFLVAVGLALLCGVRR